MNKIAIIGAGRVGESTAQILAKEELCRELVLLDIHEGMPQGVALDIQESASLLRFDTRVTGATDPAAIAGADIIIVTAGIPRKPGMSRSDVLGTNLSIIDKIVVDALEHAPDAMLIMVTNPVDVLTWYAWQKSGWPRHRVFGQSGALDTARMTSFIAMETGYSIKDISALVLGGHGDAMVPLPRFTDIAGIPITHFLSEERIHQINQRTRQGGGEILALKQHSSAYDSPAAAVAIMVDAISYNRRRILPCVSVLDGEYGQHDIAMGVPAVLTETGLTDIIELQLNADEQAAFQASADIVAADIAALR
ncbi:MAG: malate dehydrogenase [Gammaproteobacteria bacterium]|nr:malate dehydrogenase [Gammaproteobacteria bacterium]MCF6258752.1 malate dehydrogenase [Gammaproteobacteria bacterium]